MSKLIKLIKEILMFLVLMLVFIGINLLFVLMFSDFNIDEDLIPTAIYAGILAIIFAIGYKSVRGGE